MPAESIQVNTPDVALPIANIATDRVAGKDYQYVKVDKGGDGATVPVTASSGFPIEGVVGGVAVAIKGDGAGAQLAVDSISVTLATDEGSTPVAVTSTVPTPAGSAYIGDVGTFRKYLVNTFAIPSGAGASAITGGPLNDGVCDLTKYAIAGILIPANWVSSDLEFTASENPGGPFVDVYADDGAQVKILAVNIAVGVARIYVSASVLEKLSGLPYIKLKSTLTQTASKTLKILLKS